MRTHFVRFVNSKHSGWRKYAKAALKKLEKAVVYSMFFVMVMQLCACGDIHKETVSTVFNESKQYYEVPSETKLYKYSDFDWVVLGETTIIELYETVGESQGCLLLNLHMDYIYPLENGKYLSVECWYYDMENGDTDYTVDKMILLDTNPLQS